MSEIDKSISIEALESHRQDFVEKLTHVLRNQVAAIGGYADLVGSSGELNEDQSLFLERVQSGTSRLNQMLPALIDIMWLEAGIPLQHQAAAIHQIAADVIAELANRAAMKGIQVTLSVPDALPLISGDMVRLQQAVTEILHNALIYSPSGSSVSVQLWNDDQAIYCSIADQGIGMSQIDQDLIFDRLYRSSDPRVRAVQGSGLGLTLANRIIGAHGGELQVNSKLDQGSTFTLMLPLSIED